MKKTPHGSTPGIKRPSKIKVEKSSNLLLTPGSSRRRSALQRLKAVGDNRGMTQDQISAYLEKQLKSQYQKHQVEGALTYDKIQRYLDSLAKLAAEPLSKAPMDLAKIDLFGKRLNPVLSDISSKTELTPSDVEKHSRMILEEAVSHANEALSPQPEPPLPIAEEEEEIPFGDIEIELLEEDPAEVDKPVDQPAVTETINSTTPALVDDDEEEEEIIPIGFEEGAPRVGIGTFFSFPLAPEEQEPEEEERYTDHFRYLTLGVKKGVLTEEEVEMIKTESSKQPVRRYSRYFDIFPDKEYDDTRMMMVFSQWRNNALERLLISDEQMPD